MRINASVLCAVMLAVFVSCGDDVIRGDNYIENTTDKEIIMTDGNVVYSIPASTTVMVFVEYGYDDDMPELSVVNDDFPRVKVSARYINKRSRKYIIAKSDYVEYTVINTGNYPIEISGNYLGDNYGDTVIVQKQSTVIARFYNGDSTFSAKYVDETVEKATPFTNKNGTVITVL